MFQALGVTLASPVSAAPSGSEQALLLEPEGDTRRSGCQWQARVPGLQQPRRGGRQGFLFSCYFI